MAMVGQTEAAKSKEDLAMQRFVRMRARMQRLSDSRFFAGWVCEMSPQRAVIDCTDESPCVSSDDLFVTVMGPQQGLAFRGRVALVHNSRIYIDLHGPLRTVPGTEESRIRVTDLNALVLVGDTEIEATAMDVSPKGIGLRSPISVENGASVSVSILSPGHTIQATGEVRYCKPDADAPGSFRLGVQLNDMDRVSRARWTQMLSLQAA